MKIYREKNCNKIVIQKNINIKEENKLWLKDIFT